MAKPVPIGPVPPGAPAAATAAPLTASKRTPKAAAKSYVASINGRPLPLPFATGLLSLERTLRMPVWFIIQQGSPPGRMVPWEDLADDIVAGFRSSRSEMARSKPIALLIDSPGGYAEPAYTLARVLNSHCGSFVAVVPRYAKSAATLLSLGSSSLIMGTDSSLGPLDAQFDDTEREEHISALDEVHALHRLHAFALEAVDRTMLIMLGRSGKKVSTLLPIAFRFCTNIIRPLFENIDPVHYTKMSRALKVAEEYAVRLLHEHHRPVFGPGTDPDAATAIARHLVEHYPDHGFNIDYQEAKDLGLRVRETSPSQQRIMDGLVQYLPHMTAIGRVKEVTAHGKGKAKAKKSR